jgi:hypothetical protein
MQPIEFVGSRIIGKPKDMTDEQCNSIWAANGATEDGIPFWVTVWKPSDEELAILNQGGGIIVRTLSAGLPPMSLFATDLQIVPVEGEEKAGG